jgi:ABC-2 type transport system ATP-binding protein
MIRLRDLRVDYDTVCAVRDLSLEVAPGEICGLIGPNGAGKTTTMRAMIGLLEPTYGEIELAGVDIREHPRDACRVVGFMPDFPPLYEDLKCWEFLDLFAASYEVPKARRKDVIERHLDLVGLTEKRDAMAVELSRGMRQRLMLAKTLLPEPQVLLLDEPASGMDPQGRIDLKNILKSLGAQGKTILISSHILAEMTEFCTSVAIMERGRMVVSGTIASVRARVMEGMVLHVEVLSGEEAFRRIVAEHPDAGAVEHNDGVFEVHYRGDRERAAELLAALVRGGVRVAAFSPRKEGLEELFLKIGAKELS